MRIRFTFEPHAGGTRMVTMTTFPSLEVLEQLLDMGMEEGMMAAIARIDDVLAACDDSQLPFGKTAERVRD